MNSKIFYFIFKLKEYFQRSTLKTYFEKVSKEVRKFAVNFYTQFCVHLSF